MPKSMAGRVQCPVAMPGVFFAAPSGNGAAVRLRSGRRRETRIATPSVSVATSTTARMPNRRRPMSATTIRKPLTTYSFTLVFADQFEELPGELLDALFEAGCDDSHVSLREGV